MTAVRVAVLVSGSGSNLQALLDAQLQQSTQYEIVLVLSNRPGVAAITKAEQAGVPTKVIDHEDYDGRHQFEEAVQRQLEAYQVEWVVLAGFMRRLTEDFVSSYEGRILNIHPSLLPLYPGLKTHQKALAAGDLQHGCSVHFVTAVLDGGPIIAQSRCDILPGEGLKQLSLRVLRLEHDLYWRVLDAVTSGRVRYEGGAAYLDSKKIEPPHFVLL